MLIALPAYDNFLFKHKSSSFHENELVNTTYTCTRKVFFIDHKILNRKFDIHEFWNQHKNPEKISQGIFFSDDLTNFYGHYLEYVRDQQLYVYLIGTLICIGLLLSKDPSMHEDPILRAK